MYENHTLLDLAEIRILDVFLDLERHYFAELVKSTKLTRPRTLRVLRKLSNQGILEVKKEANVKYYSIKKAPLAYAVLGIAEYNRALLFFDKNKTIKRAIEMLKEKYNSYLCMLIFGSFVKGYANKRSDIDILIIKERFSKNDIRTVEDIANLINGRTGLKLSVYFMKVEEFKKKNELVREVIEKHVLIDGSELFFRMVLE